jgi:hypothetical protein
VNVATLQPPAGAGNVVTVFVPGAAVKLTEPGALTITIPEPPEPPPEPPDPPPVLTTPPPALPAVELGPPAAPCTPCPAPPAPAA